MGVSASAPDLDSPADHAVVKPSQKPARYPHGRVEARSNASLRTDSSHYGNREASVPRKAADPHLKDGCIYRMRWWAYNSNHISKTVLSIVKKGPPKWTSGTRWSCVRPVHIHRSSRNSEAGSTPVTSR